MNMLISTPQLEKLFLSLSFTTHTRYPPLIFFLTSFLLLPIQVIWKIPSGKWDVVKKDEVDLSGVDTTPLTLYN